MKHMWIHVVVIGVLLAGIVAMISGIVAGCQQIAGIAQLNAEYDLAAGTYHAVAVGSTVAGSICAAIEWLLPAVVIFSLVIAVVVIGSRHKMAQDAR